MQLAMYIDLTTDDELDEAIQEYQKAKTRLIRCLERERITAKEKTAPNEMDTVE